MSYNITETKFLLLWDLITLCYIYTYIYTYIYIYIHIYIYICRLLTKQTPPNWINQSIFQIEFMQNLLFLYVEVLSIHDVFLIYSPFLGISPDFTAFYSIKLFLCWEDKTSCTLRQHFLATQRTDLWWFFWLLIV